MGVVFRVRPCPNRSRKLRINLGSFGSENPENSFGFCKSVYLSDLETQHVAFSGNAPIGKRKKS